MKKDSLEKALKRIKKLLDDEKKDNRFLLKQQNWLKSLAEKAGGETAEWKAKSIILEDENTKLQNEIKLLKATSR